MSSPPWWKAGVCQILQLGVDFICALRCGWGVSKEYLSRDREPECPCRGVLDHRCPGGSRNPAVGYRQPVVGLLVPGLGDIRRMSQIAPEAAPKAEAEALLCRKISPYELANGFVALSGWTVSSSKRNMLGLVVGSQRISPFESCK
jgi:hypothetical protein